MEQYLQIFLMFIAFGWFYISMACTDFLKELTFERRITNDEWREKHGYVRGLLGGWKKPKDRKK